MDSTKKNDDKDEKFISSKSGGKVSGDEEVEEGQIPGSPDKGYRKDKKHNNRSNSRSSRSQSKSRSISKDSSRSDSKSKSRSRSKSSSRSRSRSRRRSRSRSRSRRRRSYSRSRSRSTSPYSGPIIKDYRRIGRGRGNFPPFNRFMRNRRPFRRFGSYGYRSKYRDYSRSRSRSFSPKRSSYQERGSYEKEIELSSTNEPKPEVLNPAEIKRSQKQNTQSFLAMLEEKQQKAKMLPVEYSKFEKEHLDAQQQQSKDHCFVHTFEKVDDSLSVLQKDGWQVIDDVESDSVNRNKSDETDDRKESQSNNKKASDTKDKTKSKRKVEEREKDTEKSDESEPNEKQSKLKSSVKVKRRSSSSSSTSSSSSEDEKEKSSLKEKESKKKSKHKKKDKSKKKKRKRDESSSSSSSNDESKSKKKKSKKKKKRSKKKDDNVKDDKGDKKDETTKEDKEASKKSKDADKKAEDHNNAETSVNSRKDKDKGKKRKHKSKVSSSSSSTSSSSDDDEEGDSEKEKSKKRKLKKKSKKKHSKKRKRTSSTSSSSSEEETDSSDSEVKKKKSKKKHKKQKKSKKSKKSSKKDTSDKHKKKSSSGKKKSKAAEEDNLKEEEKKCDENWPKELLQYTSSKPSIQFSINPNLVDEYGKLASSSEFSRSENAKVNNSDGNNGLLAFEYERFLNEVNPSFSNDDSNTKTVSDSNDYISPSEKRAIERQKKQQQKEVEMEENLKRQQDFQSAPLSTYYSSKKTSGDVEDNKETLKGNEEDNRGNNYEPFIKSSKSEDISISFSGGKVKKDDKEKQDGEEKKLTGRELLDRLNIKKEVDKSSSSDPVSGDSIKLVKKFELPITGKMKKPNKRTSDLSTDNAVNNNGPTPQSMSADFNYYVQYYMNCFGLDHYSAAYYAQYIMLTSGEYQYTDSNTWMQHQGYTVTQESAENLTNGNLIATTTSSDVKIESIDEKNQDAASEEMQIDDDAEKEAQITGNNTLPKPIEVLVPSIPLSANELFHQEGFSMKTSENEDNDNNHSTQPQAPIPRPNISSFVSTNPITLPNGQVLPAGSSQIVVHPYPSSHPLSKDFTAEAYNNAYELSQKNSDILFSDIYCKSEPPKVIS